MPASCAKALRPTIALLAWTALPVTSVSSWLAAKICLVSMPVLNGSRSDAHARRHDDFLERRVAGALADAVDGALDLTRAAGQRRQRIGDGEAEIVVAVRAPDHLVGAGHAVDQPREERLDLVGRRVADRVGQVDGRGARLDDRFDDCHRKSGSLRVASSAENCTSSVNVRARRTASIATFEAVRPRHAQLALEVQIGGGDEHVDALARGRLERPRGLLDVGAVQRASAAITGPLIAVETVRTASASASDAIGKPASMMSTPIDAS